MVKLWNYIEFLDTHELEIQEKNMRNNFGDLQRALHCHFEVNKKPYTHTHTTRTVRVEERKKNVK